jgi:anti-sigma regulatory factor (Ser/Thr protein kinase)/ActR/RegA family two-component response regulator
VESDKLITLVTEPRTRQLHTALVVGPDPDLASQVASTLPTWQIVRIPHNSEALDMLNASPFDLVVTGEDTSGAEDLKLLRQMRRVRAHTRLLILTRESTPDDVIASMREGAFSYFSSPYSPESLSDMIRLAAEGPCWDEGIEVLSATPALIQLLASCDKGTANRLLQFFHEIIDLPDPEKANVAAAFREMLLNAIEQGGHFDPTQVVEISYVRARHAVMCRVKDPGEGFSFEEIKHAAISNPPDQPLRHQEYRDARGLRAGGFGVLMTSRLVDELIYGERGNEVLLIKYLNLQSEQGNS